MHHGVSEGVESPLDDDVRKTEEEKAENEPDESVVPGVPQIPLLLITVVDNKVGEQHDHCREAST